MFVQRLSRGPLLRCHGVQECILLVTQRISKYPVLIQHILENTTGSSSFLCLLYVFSSVQKNNNKFEQIYDTQCKILSFCEIFFSENYNYYFKCSISSIFEENFSNVTLKILIFNEGHTTGFSNILDEVLGDQLV